MQSRYLEAYVTVPEACRQIVPGVTPYSLHRVCDRGYIPYLMCGRVRKVKRRDVLAWEEREKDGRAHSTPELAASASGGFDPLYD